MTEEKDTKRALDVLGAIDSLTAILQRIVVMGVAVFLIIKLWPIKPAIDDAINRAIGKPLVIDQIGSGGVSFKAQSEAGLNSALVPLERQAGVLSSKTSEQSVIEKMQLQDVINEIRSAKSRLDAIQNHNNNTSNNNDFIKINKGERTTGEYWVYLGLAKEGQMVKSQNFNISVLPSIGDVIASKSIVNKRNASPKYNEEDGWVFGTVIGTLNNNRKVKLVMLDEIDYGYDGTKATWAKVIEVY